MKYDFILHARNKMEKYVGPNGKIIYKKKGLICRPLKKEEQDKYTICSKGGVTIVVIKNNNDLKWCVAKCNMIDTYCKKIGIHNAITNTNCFITDDMSFDDVLFISKRLAEHINKCGTSIDQIKGL